MPRVRCVLGLVPRLRDAHICRENLFPDRQRPRHPSASIPTGRALVGYPAHAAPRASRRRARKSGLPDLRLLRCPISGKPEIGCLPGRGGCASLPALRGSSARGRESGREGMRATAGRGSSPATHGAPAAFDAGGSLFFIVIRDGHASKMPALLRFGEGRIVFLLLSAMAAAPRHYLQWPRPPRRCHNARVHHARGRAAGVRPRAWRSRASRAFPLAASRPTMAASRAGIFIWRTVA
jgi:hypothetical protein